MSIERSLQMLPLAGMAGWQGIRMMDKNDGKPRVWLVVEDEEVLRIALSEFLRMWGVTPLTMEDGHAAVTWLNQVASGEVDGPLPELALIDIRLPPGPQGHEVAHLLRTQKETAHMAIVLMTAFRFSPEDRAQIEQVARPDMLLLKPFPALDELREKLEAVVRLRATAEI